MLSLSSTPGSLSNSGNLKGWLDCDVADRQAAGCAARAPNNLCLQGPSVNASAPPGSDDTQPLLATAMPVSADARTGNKSVRQSAPILKHLVSPFNQKFLLTTVPKLSLLLLSLQLPIMQLDCKSSINLKTLFLPLWSPLALPSWRCYGDGGSAMNEQECWQ